MHVGSLFSGVGLLDYGLHLAGWEHRWLCEVDEFRRGILAKRFPGARVFDDVRAVGVDAERVELVAGGFPCKGASTAGKRNGFGHPETALWAEMWRVVRELRPRFVLVENVANILSLHGGEVWGTVVGDLASVGYDVEWDVLPAAAFGAPHLRERVFAVATDSDGEVGERVGGVWGEPDRWADVGGGGRGPVADADGGGSEAGAQQDERTQTRQPASLGHDAHGRGTRMEPDRAAAPGVGRGPRSDGRGVAVAWGDYEPAIRRWEQVHGPAPEPLVRRVDDRGAARVERSRLSALGDGVQVQAGYFMGRLIMERARRAVAA